jgi:hypothetical protein
MNSEIQRLLDSSNAADRKRAIQMLAKSNSEKALPYLGALYKTDPDPELRDLAVKAGRYLRQQLEPAAPPPRATSTATNEMVAAAQQASKSTEKDKGDPKPVSESNRRKSLDLMNRGMMLLVANETEQAYELVSKAVKLNHELRTDPYHMGLIENVTGLRGDEAWDSLLENEGGDKVTRKSKDTKKSRKSDEEEGSWGAAIFGMVFFYLVTAFVTASGLIALIQLSSNLLGDANMVADYSDSAIQTDLSSFVQIISANSVAIAVVYGLVTALGESLQLLLQLIIVHMCATVFGGSGDFRRLMARLPFIYAILNGVASYILFAVLYNTLQQTTADQLGIGFIENIVSIGIVVIGLSIIVQSLTTLANLLSVSHIYAVGLISALIAMVVAGVVTGFVQQVIDPVALIGQAVLRAMGVG